MTLNQRRAMFELAVGGAAILLFSTSVPVLGAERAMSCFAVLALPALEPILFPRRRRPGDEPYDEREMAIHSRSLSATLGVVYLFFIAAAVALWFVYRRGGLVPVDYMSLLAFGGGAVMLVAKAACTLYFSRQM